VGWYGKFKFYYLIILAKIDILSGSAYLFTLCAFQPIIGKVFTLLPIKYVYLGSLLTFEIGSAICGSAPNSITLILGRAIAGIGAAGDFSGGLTIIAHTVPLEKRPMGKSNQALIYEQC
jgi:MFS family permease